MIVIRTVLQSSEARTPIELMLVVNLKGTDCYFPTKVFLCKTSFQLLQEAKRNTSLSVKLRLAEKEIERSKALLISVLNTSEEYSYSEIKMRYLRKKSSLTLFKLFERVIAQKEREGSIATANSYIATLACFHKLLDYKDCTLEGISKSCIKKWTAALKEQDISYNTAVFYLRNLRSLLTIYSKKSKFSSFFNDCSFKQHKTRKRALSVDEIQELLHIDVSDSPKLQKAKDFFLMSLFLRGMPLIDLIHLKKSNLCNDALCYTRHKTGALLQVQLLPFVKELFQKYTSSPNSSYLFDVLKDKENELQMFTRYRNFLRNHNRNLNELGKVLNFSTPLSSYVARHTWATQAKYTGATVTLISESLGHSSEQITYSYLKEFENNRIDAINYKVYQSIIQ